MFHIQDASKIFSNISPFNHIKQNNSRNSPIHKVSLLKKESLNSPSRKNRNKKIHENMNYDSDNINTEINNNFYDNFLEQLQKDSNEHNNHQSLKINKKVEFEPKTPTKEESFTNFSKYVSNTKISKNYLKKKLKIKIKR